MLELIAIEDKNDHYSKWELEAFSGWQSLVHNWGSKRKPPSFEEYKKSLGIHKPGQFINNSKKSEVDKARQTLMDSGFGGVLHLLKSNTDKKGP